MGNTKSSSLQELYEFTQSHATEIDKKVRGGGSGSYHSRTTAPVDSVYDLADYDHDIRSLAKGHIGGLVQQMAMSKFGFKQPLHKLPNARTGTTFKPDVRKHKYIYDVLCDVAKKSGYACQCDHGSECVDKLSDNVASIGYAIGGEFASVKKDVERIIGNILQLNEVFKKTYKKILEALHGSKDIELKNYADSIEGAFNETVKLMEEQVAQLKRVLDIDIVYNMSDIEELIRNNGELRSLISKVRPEPGTGEYGDQLSYLLSGMGNVGALAIEVDRALKKIGLSIKDFLREKDSVKFGDEVVSKIRAHLDTDLLGDWEKLAKIIEVVDKAKYRYDDIKEFLESPAGKDIKEKLGAGEGLKIEKMFKKKRELRDAFLKSFSYRLKENFQFIVLAAKSVVAKMGTDIPITDKVDMFIRAIKNLDDIEKYGIFYALTGYSIDSNSRAIRDRYLGQIQNIIDSLEALSTESYGSYFKDMLVGFQEFKKNIMDFSEAFSKGLGPLVGRGESPEYHCSSCPDDNIEAPGASFYGRGENSEENDIQEMSEKALEHFKKNFKEGGDSLPEINSLGYTLTMAKDQILDAYVRIKIKQNLMAIHKEWSFLNEKNDLIRARAIGLRREDIMKEKKKNLDDLATAKDNSVALNPDNLYKYIRAIADGVAGKDWWSDLGIQNADDYDTADAEGRYRGEQFYKTTLADAVAACNMWIERKYTALDNLWRLVEAVEAFLSVFTEDVTMSPDDLLDLQSQFDQLKTAKDWFSEKTGNQIVSLFDDRKDITDGLKDGSHYYHLLGLHGPTTAPVQSPSPAGCFDGIGLVFKQFIGLKNLLSVIFTLGAKMHGKDIYNAIKMQPIEMYTIIIDFLTVASVVRDDTGLGISYGAAGFTNADIFGVDLRPGHFMLRSIDGKAGDCISEENTNLFHDILTSLMAKPLHILKINELFTRPLGGPEMRRSQLATTRVFMGGAEVSINQDAVQFYTRLPLIVEYYRDLFRGTTRIQVGDRCLVLLPELLGKFSNLFRIIFRNKYVSEGNYSQVDTDMMIAEITKIYESYAGKPNPIQECNSDIVAEVNRRMGITTVAEYESYENEAYEMYTMKEPGDNLFDVSILPGGEDSYVKSVMPSDKYIKHSLKFDTKELTKIQLPDDFKLVKQLIKRVTESINKGSVTAIKLDEYVKARQKELKHASSQSEKLELVRSSILGLGVFSSTLNQKASVMMHETVMPILAMLEKLRHYYSSILKKLSDTANVGAENLISMLDALNNFDLVTTKFVDDKFYVDYSRLKDVVERSLNYCSTFLNKMRPLISKDLVDRYETGSGAGVDRRMCISYQRDRFLTQMLVGKFENADDEKTRQHFGRINQYISNYIVALNKDAELAAIGKFVMYPYSKRTVVRGDVVGSKKFLGGISYVGADDPNHGVGIIPSSGVGDTSVLPTYGRSEEDLAKETGGITEMFNTLVALYVDSFHSPSTNKIYMPLLSQFVNGYFNGAVFGSENYCDLQKDSENTNIFEENTPSIGAGHPLAGSIARALRLTMTARDRKDKLRFLETELADVPIFIKDAFRVNLPTYVKLFRLMISKCQTIRNVVKVLSEGAAAVDVRTVANTGIDAEFKAMNKYAADEDLGGFVQLKSDPIEFKSQVDAYLDEVINGCVGLINSATQVLKEIDSDPMVFSTYTGFIRDYQARNGKLPFMPITSTLYLIRKWIDVNGKFVRSMNINELLPMNPMNSIGFKIQSGSSLLADDYREVSLAKMPWMAKLLEEYNMIAESRGSISSEDFNDFYSIFTSLYRVCLNDTYKQYLGSVGWHVNFKTRSAGVYSLLKKPSISAQDVSALTESSDSKELVIITNLGARGAADRKSAVIENLLELEIVPINIYALMREIPVVHIPAYSYLLKNLLTEVFDYKHRQAGTVFISDSITLPFRTVDGPAHDDMTVFEQLRASLLQSEQTFNAGKSKFLVEQLFNKALLGSYYAAEDDSYNTIMPYVGPDEQDNLTRPNVTTTPKSVTLVKTSYSNAGINDGASVVFTQNYRTNTNIVRYIIMICEMQRFLFMSVRAHQEKAEGKLRLANKVFGTDATEYFTLVDYNM